MPGKGTLPGGGREVTAAGGWGSAVEWPGSKEDGIMPKPIKTQNPLTAVAVQVIESLRARHRVEGRSGAVAVGLSLETGSCEVNHVVCGEWGWYKGPGSSPPMQRGDVITSVDGEIVLPSDVGQRLHAGPLGSKVQVKGLRGNNHTKVEATFVRQDGLIIDGLVHVEEALDEVKRAAMALGGRPGSVLEARLAALGRQVAKLGSACAKQESSLSERGAVYQSHIKELEESIIRLTQGDTDADDVVGKAAVAELLSKDALLRQVQLLESELSARESIANELAQIKSLLRESEEREMSRALVEAKERDAFSKGGAGGRGGIEGIASAELEAKLRQLQMALTIAKTDLVAAKVERDKALKEAEQTKSSANEMLRAAKREAVDEKGARELCNTKMMVAKREAEEFRAARDTEKKRSQQFEKDVTSLRASLVNVQKQLDEQRKKFDNETTQMREKANAMLKEKDTQLAKTNTELQDRREEVDQLKRSLTAQEKEAADLVSLLKALKDKHTCDVAGLDEKLRMAERQAAEAASAAAHNSLANAEFECDRLRKDTAEMHARLEELERLLLRSQEQTGALKEENWSLQQRLEEVSRSRAELEHECARLIKEIRALRLQLEENDGNLERLRDVVRQTEQHMCDTLRESEEESKDVAKLRMSNAELQGRLSEAEQRLQQCVAMLEEEKSEHSETQRKLRDAFAMVEKVRGEQRESIKLHSGAMEEQHDKEVQEVKRQGADQLRKAEDRIRELQREVVGKEEQRAAMARHADALEKKLVNAQEEARAYLKTVEGTTENHKEQQSLKEDAMRKLTLHVQQLERTMSEREVEHKDTLDRTCAELQRAAAREKEQLLVDNQNVLNGSLAERREAERKMATQHRGELDKLQQALTAKNHGVVDNLASQLRDEQHKSATRIAALEELNREIAARTEVDVRNKVRALESDCKTKFDKAFAEAAKRRANVEKTWREQVEKVEKLGKERVSALEKEVSAAERALEVQAQRIQTEHEKEVAAVKAQHEAQNAELKEAFAQAKDAVKAEQLKGKEELVRVQQVLKDKHKDEQEKRSVEQREREKEMREELQGVQKMHDTDMAALKDTHDKDLKNARQEAVEAQKDLRDRLAFKEAEMEKMGQTHRQEVKTLHADMGALKEEVAKQVERVNQMKRKLDAAVVDLAAARTSEELLQALLNDARAEGAAKEEEQRKRAADAEGQVSALKMAKAQLVGKMATSSAEVERLKGVLASQSKELPEVRSQLHDAVCSQAELQGRLHAAEEEIAAFKERTKSERAELEQQRNKVAALQSAVVEKERLDALVEKMQERMRDLEAVEQQVATLSQELADCHEKLAAFELAAAEERRQKLGPMAAVVPPGLDKWASMPKSPFTMPTFSVPSVSLGSGMSGMWGGAGRVGRDGEAVKDGDSRVVVCEDVAATCALPPAEVVEDAEQGVEDGHASEDVVRCHGGDVNGEGRRSRRELELQRQLEEAQMQMKQQRINAVDLGRKLLEARQQLNARGEEGVDDGGEGEGEDKLTTEGGCVETKAVTAEEESWETQWRQRKADGNVSTEDRFIVILRQQLAEARQQLTEAREARAGAEQDAYQVRRDLAAATRAAVDDKRAQSQAHRAEVQELLDDLKGGGSACGEKVAELKQRLCMAEAEAEGAHVAARVADAAANAAEKRVRDLEKERHEDFIGYRERESKSREHILSLSSKLNEGEEELEQVKKRLWVKEREVQILQKQLDELRGVNSGDARASTGTWKSSHGARFTAAHDLLELQSRLVATENVLAERTERLRELEKQQGEVAEDGWAKGQGFRPMSYQGRQPWPAPTAEAAMQGCGDGSGGDLSMNHQSIGRLDPLSSKAIVDDEADAWLPSGPMSLPPPAAQPVASGNFGGGGGGDDWMGESPSDDLAGRGDGGGGEEVGAHSMAATAAVPAPAGVSGQRGLFGGLSSSVTNGMNGVTNSMSGLTSRSFGGWSAKLPFLPSNKSQQQQQQRAASAATSSTPPATHSAAHAPPPVSPAPATLPFTPPTPANEGVLPAATLSSATISPSSNTGGRHGLWGGTVVAASRGAGEEQRDPLSGGWNNEDTEERWMGTRGKVDEAVLESRQLRGFYHSLDRQREDADEINRIRSSRGVPGGTGNAGMGSARNGDAGKSNGKRTSWDRTLVESSSERMERLRGNAPAPAEDQAEASLFLSQQWMDELRDAGKGNSGATTAQILGRSASQHRAVESSLWHRSAADSATRA